MRPSLLVLLVMLASGPATAEIRLSGDAAMGLTSSGKTTQATTDLDLTIEATRVTDGGVEFGAVLELNDNAGQGSRPTAGYFFVQSGSN